MGIVHVILSAFSAVQLRSISEPADTGVGDSVGPGSPTSGLTTSNKYVHLNRSNTPQHGVTSAPFLVLT